MADASPYQVLADTAEDHIFVIDRDDRVEYVNPAAARQLGAVPERLIGRRRTELFPPDVAARQGQNLAKVFASGHPLYAEGRTMYGEREVWLSTWLTPLRTAEGVVTAVLGVSRDMTERKRLEDELRTADQRQRVVWSNVPVIVWTADPAGALTFCAGLGLQPLGLTAEDAIGRTFDQLDAPPFRLLHDAVARALAGESVNRKVAAQERTFETWSVPLRSERDDVTGATGCMVDITERLRLEAELANAQRLEALGRLAAGIAHDFNNNLTAILGYVELIADRADHEPSIAQHLTEVRRAAERSTDLVRRLLAFGRRQVLRTSNVDLNAVVSAVRPTLERVLGARVRMDVRAAPSLPAVSADAGELEQVIMNLALNARDAMPDGGTLTLETADVTVAPGLRAAVPPGRYALLRVRDSGIGMPPHVREHAFDPFFTTKPQGQGTGLGLSAVYGIVRQLDGAIAIESAVGRGTSFDVYFPAILEPPVEQAPAVTSAVEPSRVGAILLVEDEETVRRFARIALERHGFRVIEAATPLEALARGRSDASIALLLTDVVMPRMNGRELAVHLRQARPGLQVLFMSGYPSSLVMPDGTIDSSVNLLSKPFTTAQLVAAVRSAISAQA
ncbi:MAG: PAS domain-containing protein [Acidobacteria bacterium]|nr:PAS domain-containing protein [Acidobacteriota bacterium]